jgi:hypothetical protein
VKHLLKGAPGITINRSLSLQRYSAQSRPRTQPEQYKCTNTANRPHHHYNYIHTARASPITHTRRGHRLSHRLNLRNDTHLPVIKQHYPQFLTLKKLPKMPFAYARPIRRRQQFSLTNLVYSKSTTLHPRATAPATPRKFTHTLFSHHPSPPTTSTCTRKILSTLHTRQSPRRSHIQRNKIV